MVLVAGATGHLGGEICRRLVAADRRVRGLVRPTSDPAIVARLHTLGVETVEGDLKDPASLTRACRGVDAVISTVTTMRSRQPDDGIETTDQAGLVALAVAQGDAIPMDETLDRYQLHPTSVRDYARAAVARA